MRTKYLPLLMLLLFSRSIASAQGQRNMELEKIVKADVKNFRLSKADLKTYRKSKSGRTSDYFKPKAENVKDIALLIDSSYIQKYRHLAYSKNAMRKGVGTYLILTAAAAVMAAITIVITL